MGWGLEGGSGEEETSVKRVIDIDAELCKPWDKIACLEKETRLETWQYFMMKHIQDIFPEVGLSMQEAKGSSPAKFGTSSLWKWAQNKGWVWSSVPNGNNCFLIWDSFSQTSRTIETNGFKGQGNRQTMLGTPENPATSPCASVTTEKTDNNQSSLKQSV